MFVVIPLPERTSMQAVEKIDIKVDRNGNEYVGKWG